MDNIIHNLYIYMYMYTYTHVHNNIHNVYIKYGVIIYLRYNIYMHWNMSCIQLIVGESSERQSVSLCDSGLLR